MKKLLFITFTLYYSLFTLLNAAGVQAKVSTTEVVQGNMVQLKLIADGNRVAFPNIQDIEGIPVLGRHEGQNNSYSYVNGKMTNAHSTTLVLTFAPQKDMRIPSYSVNIDGKMYKTKPIEVKVVKSTVPKSAGNEKFSLRLRSNKTSVIVGEPLLVTVYFSFQNGVRLSTQPEYNKPEFKGFFAKEAGEEKNYNEGNRQVTELRYILTPKAEGNYTVGPASAKVGIADRSKRDMFGRFFGTTWTPLVSNTVAIEVKAKPQESDLVGTFTLEQQIDAQKVKPNKPVNLRVKLSGEGNLEDFVFPAYDIDGVTVYSDDAKITTTLADGKIHSTYVKSFAFIADHDFTIPKRTISVYDIQSKSLKTLEIPAYNIEVEGANLPAGAESSAAPASGTPKAGVVQTNLKVEKKSMLDDGEAKVSPPEEKTQGWLLALAFVSGLIVMYLLRYVPTVKWRSKSSVNETEALKILYPHINTSAEVESMVRKLYAKKNGDKSVEIDKKILKEMLEKFADV